MASVGCDQPRSESGKMVSQQQTVRTPSSGADVYADQLWSHQLRTNQAPSCTPPVVRRSPRSRSCSTLGSQLSTRVPLQFFSEALKARKVIFYRNGDPFYKGLQYAVKSMLRKMEPYQAFEHLLADINKSGLCDMNILKQGVRYIFSLNGTLVTDVDQLDDGCGYVCSSTPVYKDLDYGGVSTVDWVVTTKKVNSPSCAISMDTTPHQRFIERASDVSSSKAFLPTCNKMIVVIRAGPRPRNIVRKLLNKRSANSYDHLLTHLARALNVESGIIKHIYSLYGRPITELQDFFLEDRVFVAFGNDKQSPDDFKISDIESKFIDSACGPSSASVCPTSIGGLRVRGRSESAIRTTSDTASEFGAAATEASSYRTLTTMPNNAPTVKTNSAIMTRPVSSCCSSVAPPAAAAGSRMMSPVTGCSSGAPTASISTHSRAPQVLMRVNRGHSGKAYGIPIPLLARYKIGRALVEGDFVTVKRCYEKSKEGRKCALKIMMKDYLSDEDTGLLGRELAILRRIRHANTVQLLDELHTPNEWYLIMDLFPGGDLFDAIVLADKFRYTESTVSWVLRELFLALDFMHSRNVTHRNIRLENILVTDLSQNERWLKLGDFGVATEVTCFLHDIVGSELFQAPEMFTAKGYGLKADIWAAGVLCYILLCGFPPFGSALSVRQVLVEVGCKQVVFTSPFWDRISDAAKDLVLFMLEADQFVRGTASDMLEHPWIAEPINTANDIDMHGSVASKMQDLMVRTARQTPASVALVAVSAVDRGQGYQRKNITGGSPRGSPCTSLNNSLNNSGQNSPRVSPRSDPGSLHGLNSSLQFIESASAAAADNDYDDDSITPAQPPFHSLAV